MMANTTPTEVSLPEKPILNNLPPRVRTFVDREEEIARVTKFLLDPHVPIVNIVGLAGVGKTALALEVAHLLLEQGQFPGGVCWVYCRDQDRALAEILEIVQRTFDLRPRVASRDAVRQYLTSNKALLVLNDYDAVTHDLEGLGFLGSLVGPGKVLLTSRVRVARMARAAEFQLGGLTLEDGIRLFQQTAKSYGASIPSGEETAVAELVHLLDGHPFAIRLAAAQATKLSLPLDMLKKRLREGWPAPELKTVLDASTDILSEPARTLFRRLAVFAAEIHEKALIEVCQVNGWQDAVGELELAGLVRRVGDRYQLHPVTRAAALAELERQNEREEHERRAAAYYLRLAQAAEDELHDGQFSIASDAIRADVANMLAGQEWYWTHEDWPQVIAYADALHNLLALSDFLDARLTVIQRALTASKRSGDKRAESHLSSRFGDLLRQTGRPQEAMALYEESLRTFHALGDTRSVAVTQTSLADVLSQTGRPQEAITLYEESLRTFRALGDTRSVAVTQTSLADVLSQMGRPREAMALYEESLRMFHALGDTRSIAVTQGSLADVLSQMGRPQEALALYEESLRMFHALGDTRSIAVTQGSLADVLSQMGRPQAAMALYEESLRIKKALGDTREVAVTQSSLADELRQAGRPQEALALYEESLRMFHVLGDTQSVAVTQSSLADVLSQMGRPQEAMALYQDALAQFQAMGARQSEAFTLNNLAYIHRALAVAAAREGDVLAEQTQNQQALAYLDRSSDLFESVGDAASLAVVQRLRARVLDELGKEKLDETIGALAKSLASSLTSASQPAAMRAAGGVVEFGKRLVAQGRYHDTLHLTTRLTEEVERIERDANRVYESPLSPKEAEIHRIFRESPPTYQTLIRYDQQVLETVGLIKSILSVIAGVATARIDGVPTQDYDAALQALELGRQVDKTTGQAFHLAQWVRETSGVEIVELEDAEDWPPRVAYLVHLAARHERDENWQAAIGIYRQACEILSSAKSQKELARSSEIGFRLALCLKQAGRWSEALKQQEANIAAYRKLGDSAGKANAYMEIGHIYQMMNLFDPALLYYGEAYYLYLQAAEKPGDEASRRSARHGMANAKESLGNLEFQLKVLPKGGSDLEQARQLYLDLGIPGKAAIIGQTLETAQAISGGKHG
jgi:tetratricopeptide (TPR) repeat protein